MLALISMFASTALAGEMRVHIEGGTLPTGEALDSYSVSGNNLRHGGLRGGYSLTDKLELTASFSAGTSASRVDYVEYPEEDLALRLNTWTYGLGARYIVGNGGLHPYALAQARLFQGGLRMDGSPSRDDNLDQFVERAFSPGAYSALGLELVVLDEKPLAPSLFVEAGYSWLMDARFGDAGSVSDMRGVAGRAGIGVVF